MTPPSYLLAALALVALPSIGSAQDPELNRIELDNGYEVLWFINAPYIGGPVSDFDPTGDLYWKAFPADVLRRTDGVASLTGLELQNHDSDPFSTQTLWAYSLSAGTTATDGTILPTFPPAVFVPGLSTTAQIFPVTECAGPGYLTGWAYDEVFLDVSGIPMGLIDLTADGSVDWVFTHYFPGPGLADHDLLGGPLNSCGTTGDATLQWAGSSDGFSLVGSGENQADWTGLGNSVYSGFTIGGTGTFTPIPDNPDDTPDVAFFFDGPTISPFVDTNNGDGFGLDPGVGALRFPLASGPGLQVKSVGLRIYDASGLTSTKYAFAFANLGDSLLTSTGSGIPFLGGTLALNPADPAFIASHFAFGRGELAPTGDGDEALFTTKQMAFDVGLPAVAAALIGGTVELQGFTMDPFGAAEGTNVMTFHFYDSEAP